MSHINVLVVDDEKAMVVLYSRTFANEMIASIDEFNHLDSKLFNDEYENETNEVKFNLVTCTQGEEAVQAAKTAASNNEAFHIAFVDFRMPPGQNGLETSKQIRECSPLTDIVMVTGYTDMNLSELSNQVPPNNKIALVKKPFSKVDLVERAVSSYEKFIA